MLFPTVTEITPRLEAVTRDTFIAAPRRLVVLPGGRQQRPAAADGVVASAPALHVVAA